MTEKSERCFLKLKFIVCVTVFVCAGATLAMFVLLGHRSKVPEIQQALLDANHFEADQVIPKARDFVHRHGIKASSELPWLKARHCKFTPYNSRKTGIAYLNAGGLHFRVLKLDDGSGEIMFFNDYAESSKLPTVGNPRDPLVKLQAQTNLLNLQSALNLAQRHFLEEGFDSNRFSEPLIKKFDWWSGTTDHANERGTQRGEMHLIQAFPPWGDWQSNTNHRQIDQRIMLPYYHVRWVVKGEDPQADHLVREVKMDVSGISSNIFSYSAMFDRDDFENHLKNFRLKQIEKQSR